MEPFYYMFGQTRNYRFQADKAKLPTAHECPRWLEIIPLIVADIGLAAAVSVHNVDLPWVTTKGKGMKCSLLAVR